MTAAVAPSQSVTAYQGAEWLKNYVMKSPAATPATKRRGKVLFRYVGSEKKPVVNGVAIGGAPAPVPEVTIPVSVREQHLTKSIVNMLYGDDDNIERLAFTVDPSQTSNTKGVYKDKHRGLPNAVMKRLAVQDDLIAAIRTARAHHLSQFGRKRKDRFSLGLEMVMRPEIEETFTDEQKEQWADRANKFLERLTTCGNTEGYTPDQQLMFSTLLNVCTKDAVTIGAISIEPIYVGEGDSKKFHSIRPVDAGTIYFAEPGSPHLKNLRSMAFEKKKRLAGPIRGALMQAESSGDIETGDIAYVQVIEGRPENAFTHDELIWHNYYPVNDIEYRGYPCPPLDSVIAAVTTHINITTHNKNYFQAGRAARGIFVLQSEDVDDTTIDDIKRQFNAAANSVQNSWRTPVIAVGVDDKVDWLSTDTSQRDMEYQYLSDQNARTILSAFQMSPEELPGLAHLSRGTANQSLSESNQEYLLIAHRDVGLRPLINTWQEVLNERIMPLFDPELSTVYEIHLKGLDAETAEKESIRIQQDAPVWMAFNDILEKVEKDPIKKLMGGDFPFNQQFQAVLDKYVPVGEIQEYFFGRAGASKDPQWAYVRDPFWDKNREYLMQQQLQAQQAQMQQQQMQQGGPPQGGGGAPQDGPPPGQDPQQKGANEQSAGQESDTASQQAAGEIEGMAGDAQAMLKFELPLNQKRARAAHGALVDRFRVDWEKDSESHLRELVRSLESGNGA